MMYKYIPLFFVFFCMLVGCSNNSSNENSGNYDETKKMVIDIMKTDDGKKTLEEIFEDNTFKETIIMDQEVVMNAVEKNLTSEKAMKFWEKAFKNPEFAASYAKSLEDEHKKVLKALMKDPDYRKLLMEAYQDPEMEKELLKVLKSAEYRKEIKELIIETVDSPLVQEKLQKIILQAAEQLPAESSNQKGGKEGQTSTGGGGGQSGGDSGGDSSGGSGGS